VVVAEIVAAQIDAKRAASNPNTGPWFQRGVTFGGLALSAYGIGSDRWVGVSKGAFYTIIGVVAANIGNWVYDKVNKNTTTAVKGGDILSLVPKSKMALASGGAGSGASGAATAAALAALMQQKQVAQSGNGTLQPKAAQGGRGWL
jgi:hypothetical protein